MEQDTKREWFVFYRSFWEAINELPEKNQLEIYKAISDYSFTLKEPELSWLSKTIWILIKPQIEANNRKFLNWSKAKTKQEESKTEANEKQNGSENEANEKQSESKREGKEKEKDKVKDKDKDKVKELSTIVEEQALEATQKYWKKEITEALSFLSTTIWIDEFKEPIAKQRQYANHIVKLVEKIWKEEFIWRLKGVLSDSFKKKNCNSIAYLYRELKSYIHEEKSLVPTEDKVINSIWIL
jgi:hypothetical protein